MQGGSQQGESGGIQSGNEVKRYLVSCVSCGFGARNILSARNPLS